MEKAFFEKIEVGFSQKNATKQESRHILVTGANGQLGSELVPCLAARYGADRIIASDIMPAKQEHGVAHEILDVMDAPALDALIRRHDVGQIYHLAAALSATGEKKPHLTWSLNMEGLLNVLEAANRHKLEKIFWPSSIGAFGASTPALNTPQQTIMEPETIYGISKLAGEGWCRWYRLNKGLDVRSIRYPGLISYKAPPGGGTTDYAIDIFHAALEQFPKSVKRFSDKNCGENKGLEQISDSEIAHSALAHKTYICPIEADTALPMMYMPDALRATLELMSADIDLATMPSSYNLAAISFTPAQLAAQIRQHIPDFTISYQPDNRQTIAAHWPDSIDDSAARRDWGWREEFDLAAMVADMIAQLKNSK